VDPVASSSLLQIGAQYGFNALLVLVLLVGIYKICIAFLGAIEKLGLRLEVNTAALNTVVETVRAQGRSIDELKEAVAK
jgi:hypothetical protein